MSRGSQLKLRVLLVIAISALVLAGVLGTTALHAFQFSRHARHEADRALRSAALAVQTKAESLLEPAMVIARQIRGMPSTELLADGVTSVTGGLADSRSIFERFPEMIEIIPAFNPQIHGAYLGFPDGSFVSLTRNTPALRQLAELPDAAASALLRLQRNASSHSVADRWSWQEGSSWRTVERAPLEFDPRERPWYRLGQTESEPAWTELYRFAVDEGYGITLTSGLRHPNEDLAAVLGVDLRLDDLTDFVRTLDISANGFAFIAQSSGKLVAHPKLTSAQLTADGSKEAPTLLGAHLEDSSDVRVFEAFGKKEMEAEAVTVVIDGEPFMGRRLPIRGYFGFNADLYVGAPLSDFTVTADRMAVQSLTVTAVLALVVVAIGTLIARAVVRPVSAAVARMNAVAELDLGEQMAPQRSRLAEIDALNASVGVMQTALRSFGRYVPRELVRNLLELREPLELGGHRREITVLFTDIEGFTRMTETEQHEQMIDGLADYFEIVCGTISRCGGTVDKFTGDGVMAFWGAPRDDAEHSRHACAAVADIVEQLAAFNQTREKKGLSALKTRFGLHRGYAFVGNIGSRERLAYTALGDVVNTASRVEALNCELGTRVLASYDVVASAGTEQRFLDRGTFKLEGKAKEVQVYEMLPRQPEKAAANVLQIVADDDVSQQLVNEEYRYA